MCIVPTQAASEIERYLSSGTATADQTSAGATVSSSVSTIPLHCRLRLLFFLACPQAPCLRPAPRRPRRSVCLPSCNGCFSVDPIADEDIPSLASGASPRTTRSTETLGATLCGRKSNLLGQVQYDGGFPIHSACAQVPPRKQNGTRIWQIRSADTKCFSRYSSQMHAFNYFLQDTVLVIGDFAR